MPEKPITEEVSTRRFALSMSSPWIFKAPVENSHKPEINASIMGGGEIISSTALDIAEKNIMEKQTVKMLCAAELIAAVNAESAERVLVLTRVGGEE